MSTDWAERGVACFWTAVLCVTLWTGCGADQPPPQYRAIPAPADAGAEARAAIERLNSPDPLARAHGAFLLGEMSQQGDIAEAPLLAALQDGNYMVRSRAVEALGKVKAEAAIDPLIAIMNKPQEDREVRARTAEALGRLQAARAVESLTAALDDIVWRVRYQAVIALGRIGDLAAATALTNAAEYDPDFGVRQAAQAALQQLPAAIEPSRPDPQP